MLEEKEPLESVREEQSEGIHVEEPVEEERPPIKEPLFSRLDTFEEGGLDERLLSVVASLDWHKPTPVQGLCLPYTLAGRDVAGFAQTGTGKTGVFLITIAQRLLALGERASRQDDTALPFGVILAPTRELAMQIEDDAKTILGKLGISSIAVFGGIDYEKQAKGLKGGIDVIVATPGRLKDYYQKKIVSLKDCQVFVCDEADRMFDMGFIDDVEFFLSKLGERTQRLLFSATTNDQVKELAFEYLETPEYISVSPEIITPELIEQHAIICEAKDKLKVIMGLLRDHEPNRAIVFANTKIVADWLHYKLANNGIPADVITGDLPQKKRIQLIHKIKAGELKILIGTDVASRGLHISGVTHVYNFDLPDEPANYVHRIGRTARAGARGHSYSLVCEDYGHNLPSIQELLGSTLDLKSEWYSPDYLTIEDKAGNPFDDSEFRGRNLRQDRDKGARPSEERPRERDRDRDRGDRGRDTRKGASARDGQQRPPRGDRPARPRHREEQAAQGDAHASESRRSAKKEFMSKGSGRDHKRPYDRAERAPNGGHSDRHRRDHNRPDRSQQPGASVANVSQAVKAPTSITGLIKRFFAAIFGK